MRNYFHSCFILCGAFFSVANTKPPVTGGGGGGFGRGPSCVMKTVLTSINATSSLLNKTKLSKVRR